jgi:hypothetical protein
MIDLPKPLEENQEVCILEPVPSEDICPASSTHPSLNSVTSPTVTTAQAAYYLNRKSQTLRNWACRENGPIQPVRINGRLHWLTADLRRILGGQK